MESKFGFDFLTGLGGLTLTLILSIISFLVVIITIWLFWKIFKKAGFPGPLGILMIIPFVNLIMLMILAFFEWPIYKKFTSLKQRAKTNKQGASSTKRDNKELNLSEDLKIILDKSLPLEGERQLETEEEKESNEPAITLLTEKDSLDKKEEDKKETNSS